MSGTGSIHDIRSDKYDREIRFPGRSIYACVLAAYYAGKGYTTHATAQAVIAESKRNAKYSHGIIDSDGMSYDIKPGDYEDELEPTGQSFRD